MKLNLLQSRIKEKEIDLLLLLHPDPNIAYFSQVEPSHSVLQITKDSATILLSKLDDLTPSQGITAIPYTKSYKDDIKEQLTSIEAPKIAINFSQLTVKQFNTLKNDFPTATFIDFSEQLNNLRLTKTEAELKIMFQAANIADNALNNFTKDYKQSNGQDFPTELSVALFLEKKIREQGATLSFPTIVATSPNSAIPHHITSTDKLEPGLLLINMGAKINNYCSDMTRMFSIANPTEEMQADFDLLDSVQRKCIKKAEELIKSDQSLGALDAFARAELGEEKSKSFIHSLGHGIGVEVHEAPRVSKGCKQKIQKNMPFTIEPGIYFKGKWGLRIEDTVVFDGEKIIRITKSPKELIIL